MGTHREVAAVEEEAAVVEEATNLEEVQDRSQPGPYQEAEDLEVN